MEIRDIRAALQTERKQSELQDLPDDFYENVNELLEELHGKRDALVEDSADPFSDDEIQQVTDKIETVQDNVESLYQRRSGKIVKKASFTAAEINEGIDGVTTEEKEIFDSLVTELKNGQQKVFNTVNPGTTDTEQTANQQAENTTETTKTVQTNQEEPAQPEEALLNASEDTAGESGSDADEEKKPSNTLSSEANASEDGETATESEENDTVKQNSWKAESKSTDEDSNSENEGTEKDGSAIEDFGENTPVDVERITVRIKDEVGEIMGVDNREYDLTEEDVVTLPETNAEALINKNAATKIGAITSNSD